MTQQSDRERAHKEYYEKFLSDNKLGIINMRTQWLRTDFLAGWDACEEKMRVSIWNDAIDAAIKAGCKECEPSGCCPSWQAECSSYAAMKALKRNAEGK